MKDTSLEPYYAEAASWDADRVAQRRRTTQWALVVAGAGWLCALASAGALVALTPLKRVEPYVIRVDNTTGIVDVVPAYSGHASLPEAVTRYFLSHYVTVCERFEFATAESDYDECGAFHGAARNQVWAAHWARSNPNSPLNLFRDGTSIRADVRAVSFIQRANGVQDLAQVRYTKYRRQGGGELEIPTHWVATIQYVFAEPSADPVVRRWNPLGFKVVEFHAEPEVLNELPATPAATVATATPAVASEQRP
jgi:type IV secretion system protein VirB8